MDAVQFLSQAFWFLARPGNLLLILLVIGAIAAWARPRTSARIWLTALSAVLLLATLLPVHDWIARPLEERFSSPEPLPERIEGIVVLGGIVQGRTAEQRGVLAVNGTAERVMVAVELALRYPEARLVISGRTEDAGSLTRWLSAVGVPPARVEFEAVSRNTFENALLSQRLTDPGPDETWLLVTSARHMPRAVGVFRKIGWDVIPYPVDYKTFDAGPFEDLPDVSETLLNIGGALKEWIGLVAYYALDRTKELYPAPVE